MTTQATKCICCNSYEEDLVPVETPDGTVLFCHECVHDAEVCMQLGEYAYIGAIFPCAGCKRLFTHHKFWEWFANPVSASDNLERYCPDCEDVYLVPCQACDSWELKGSAVETDDGFLCVECAEEMGLSD